MFSRLAGTGHVRDREKFFSSSFIILSSKTNLVFCSTLYNQRLACKLNRPVFDRTHLVFQGPIAGSLTSIIPRYSRAPQLVVSPALSPGIPGLHSWQSHQHYPQVGISGLHSWQSHQHYPQLFQGPQLAVSPTLSLIGNQGPHSCSLVSITALTI